jgi:bifunctional non-homologous end joining protein LigD
VAVQLRELLATLSLACWVKTSGKTGLHVVVPICRTLPYDGVREVARFVGEHLAQAQRALITTEWSVDKRRGKVFLDTNMNVRAKSMPLPYSPRGLAGAPVSMPLRWEDLARAYPTAFRLAGLLARPVPRADPWSGLARHKQSLETRLTRRQAG